MKKSFFILLVPLMLVLHGSSCSKSTPNEWQTVVNARAVEYNTTVPVSNAAVVLFAGARIQAETITDAQGRFHFDFIATPGVVYQVFVTPDTLHTKKRYFQTRVWYLNEGKVNTFEYPVTPYAYVQMHLKNVNPVNENDRISVNSPLFLGRAFRGRAVDTTFIDYAWSNDTVPIIYWIYRNNVSIVHQNSKFLPAHDTTFIEILY